MSSERRRYYRIDDRALIKYRLIDADMLHDERRYIFLNEVKASNLHAALMGIDLSLQELVGRIRENNKPVAEAIELMNRKLTLIERVVALEQMNTGTIDRSDHHWDRPEGANAWASAC